MLPYELVKDQTPRCGKQLIHELSELTRDNQYPLNKVRCDICKSFKVIKTFIKCEWAANRESEQFSIQTAFHKYFTDERNCGRSRTQCIKCDRVLFVQMVKQSDFVTIEYIKCTNKLCEMVNRIVEPNGPSEEIFPNTLQLFKAKKKKIFSTKRTEQSNQSVRFGQTSRNDSGLLLNNKFSALINEGNYDSSDIESDAPSFDRAQMPRTGKRKNLTSPEATGQQRQVKRTLQQTAGIRDPVETSENRAPPARQQREFESRSQPATVSNDVITEKAQVDKLHKPQNTSRPADRRFPAVVVYAGNYIDSDKAAAMLAKQTDSTFSVDDVRKRFFFRPRSLESRTKLLDLLAAKPDVEYFTYGAKQERRPSRKFVAKGARTAGYTEEELVRSITDDYAITPTRVIPLQKEVMLLIFPGEIDSRDIRGIYRIADQRVKIEKYKVKRTAVTQCKNCLAFGHVQAHCHMKKAEATITVDSENGECKTLCSTCRVEGHNAKQAKCPAFQKEITANKKRREDFIKNNIESRAQQGTKLVNAAIKKGVSYAQAVDNRQKNAGSPSESLELLGKLLTPEIVMKLVKFLSTFAG